MNSQLFFLLLIFIAEEAKGTLLQIYDQDLKVSDDVISTRNERCHH